MQLVSFFSGAGGLDLGFSNAGFHVQWANEYDSDVWATFEHNHPDTQLDRRSIADIAADEVPECDGIIGGPPCQSWSAAGALRGVKDKRGQLFFDFIRILEAKQPKFFLAENVAGMLAPRHRTALKQIKKMFAKAGKGYELSFQMLNASDYSVPQDRKRVFFVGYRKDLGLKFQFPEAHQEQVTLEDVIWDLKGKAVSAAPGNYASPNCKVANHEYWTGSYSSLYMSRNRVRGWDEPSFTIQAGGRHAPLHPQAPKMELVEKDVRRFVPGYEHLYRRLSVRECARIQTFPDEFTFKYKNVAAGYKMIGNAVPVKLAEALALKIRVDLMVARHKKKSLKSSLAV